MPIPPLVVSGQLIAASHINAIRSQLPLMVDGSQSEPGMRFESDPDTGLHRSATNTLDIVAGGTSRLRVAPSVVTTFVPLQSRGSAGSYSSEFTDSANSTLRVVHSSAPVSNSAILQAQSTASVVLAAQGGGIVAALFGSTGKASFAQITLSNAQVAALTTACAGGGYGAIKLLSVAANVYGEVFIRGGLNSVIEIHDLSGNIATTDTPSSLCIVAAGSATYHMINRLGVSVTVNMQFLGQ